MMPLRTRISSRALSILLVACSLLSVSSHSVGQEVVTSADSSPTAAGTDAFARVIANQKIMESNLDLYERIQRVEIHKSDSGASALETKVWRVFPCGAAVTKIPLSLKGEPLTPLSYRAELEKLAKYLAWVVQEGAPQREAYAKMEHKRKERNELIASTQDAFLFTRIGIEPRGDQMLVKYSMRPNPAFKPSTRNAIIFSKVSGVVWIEEHSGELAKVEGSVTEDISIAMFLAKVYKGSHFMQERYEFFPGIWFPSYEQYDFDGRKFLLPFSIHERTFYSAYKRVGAPAESIALVRAELDKLPSK